MRLVLNRLVLNRLALKTLLVTTAMTALITTSGVALADGNWHGKDRRAFMEDTLSKLPEADADKFRDTMKASHEKDQALLDKLKTLHEQKKAILEAEDFDQKAYIAKNKEITRLHDTLQTHMTNAFVSAVADLPQDERKILAESWHGHHHGKSGDDAKDDASAPDTNG